MLKYLLDFGNFNYRYGVSILFQQNILLKKWDLDLKMNFIIVFIVKNYNEFVVQMEKVNKFLVKIGYNLSTNTFAMVILEQKNIVK